MSFGNVQKIFKSLKAIDHIGELLKYKIPLSHKGGYLLSVAKCHCNEEGLIRTLCEWRNANVEVYPTQFKATFESTRNWLLNNLLKNEGRILFLIYDSSDTLIGHIGFSNCLETESEMEIDNVIRGNRRTAGIMSDALITIIAWGRESIGASRFILRVFAENKHAIEFYRKNGFVEECEIPLKRLEKDGIISFVPAEDKQVDKIFLKMIYSGSGVN